MRVAAEDTELLGCPIKQGDMVSISLGSVDTDEAALPDAYDVRFDREVNPHNAFGGGVHRCLGSHLARLELRVAMREWHRRIPEYAVQDGSRARLHARDPLARHVPDGVHESLTVAASSTSTSVSPSASASYSATVGVARGALPGTYPRKRSVRADDLAAELDEALRATAPG